MGLRSFLSDALALGKGIQAQAEHEYYARHGKLYPHVLPYMVGQGRGNEAEDERMGRDDSDIPSSLEAREKDLEIREAAIHDQYATGYGGLYQPLTARGNSEAYRRNLIRRYQSQHLEAAHALYKFNPIASRAINITAEYVIGDGIMYTAANERVGKVLNRHWDDPTNAWSIRQLDRVKELGLTGEIIVNVSVNPHNGAVTLGHIDPELVDQVIVDPNNNMRMYALLLRSNTSESGLAGPQMKRRAFRVINVTDSSTVAPESKVYGRRVGLPRSAEEAEMWGMSIYRGKTSTISDLRSFGISEGVNFDIEWVGACFFHKVNAPIGATRGWSDLLSSMDTIDLQYQYMFANAEKAINAGRYIIDVLLKNMTPTQMEQWFRENRRMLTTGQWIVRNENMEIDFKFPDMKMQDAATFNDTLKNQALSGLGHPSIWYGDAGAARAVAPEMTEPTFKHLRSRQREFAYFVSEVFRFVIDQAVLYGYLPLDGRVSPGSEAARRSCSFFLRLPDVSAKDQRMLSIAVSNFANAITTMRENGLIDTERGTQIFERYCELLGFDAWKGEAKTQSTDVTLDPNQLADRIFMAMDVNVAELQNPETRRNEYTVDGHTYYMYPDYEMGSEIEKSLHLDPVTKQLTFA